MKINERYKGIKPILNQEFGNNKVISELTFCDSKGNNYWIVECVCGNQRYVRTDILRRGESSQCKVCRNTQNYINNINIGLLHKKDYSPKHQGYKGLPKSIFNDYKSGAKRRDLEFKINIEYIWDLLEKQNFKCALSGIDIHLIKDGDLITKVENGNRNLDFSKWTASLDRIDSTKGYIEGNVQWVHRDINKIKMDLPQDYFIELCKSISNHVNQQPS